MIVLKTCLIFYLFLFLFLFFRVEALKATLIKKKECNAKVLTIVESWIEGVVSEDDLISNVSKLKIDIMLFFFFLQLLCPYFCVNSSICLKKIDGRKIFNHHKHTPSPKEHLNIYLVHYIRGLPTSILHQNK